MIRWLRPSRPEVAPRAVRFDVHSHLLPGVDDGAQRLAEALACVAGLGALGYGGAVTTPHILPGMFDNEEDDLRERFGAFAEEVDRAAPGFRLALGAEYYFDDDLWRRVREGDPRLLRFGACGNLMLVEFAPAEAPLNAEAFFADCRRRGLVPVIAHVERYRFARGPGGEGVLRRWREAGARAQMNVGSVAGQYGQTIRRAARALWKEGLIDLLGTDLHREAGLEHAARGWRWLGRHGGGFDSAPQRGLIEDEPARAVATGYRAADHRE